MYCESTYLDKWTGAGLNKLWFQLDPEGATQIVNLQLHHPLRIWNSVRFDNGLEVLVNGFWKKATPFLSKLNKELPDWTSSENPKQKWTCNAFGMIPRAGYEWEDLPFCAHLSEKQLAFVQKKAARLKSPKESNQPHPYTLEIISGWKKTDSYHLKSGFNENLRSSQHPYFRLIDAKGTVYAGGYLSEKPQSLKTLFHKNRGSLRAPDPYETIPLNGKIVTRMAISRQAFEQTRDFINTTQKQEKYFHYFFHNCTHFIEKVLHKAGFEVNTRIYFLRALFSLLPLRLQKLLNPVSWGLRKVEWLCPIKIAVPQKLVKWQMRQPSTTVYAKGTPFHQQYC